MATKGFKIFCDATPGANNAATDAIGSDSQQQQLNEKREPLGLKQPASSKVVLAPRPIQQQQPQQQPPPQHSSTTATTTTTNTTTSNNDNVAATTNTTFSDEDQENDISMASLGSDFVPSILHESTSTTESYDDFEISVSSDIDDDEEVQMELSQAFNNHNDSQLFKSTIYIDDIDDYMKNLERRPDLRPLPDYMTFQTDIDSNKRAILINWLVEVAEEYCLQSETMFICAAIIDRFLSKMSITTSNLQLLGVASMLIASKYEEIYPPYLHHLVEVADYTYTGQQIRQMEQEILKTLDFELSTPTISFFLRKIFAYNKFTKEVFHLAEYLCYLSLLVDKPFLEYYPSDVALAAVILAALQLGADANISTDLRAAYDSSNLDQLHRRTPPKGVKIHEADRRTYIDNKDLPFCIEALRAVQERAYSRSMPNQTDAAVRSRFSLDEYSRVALLPPVESCELKSKLSQW